MYSKKLCCYIFFKLAHSAVGNTKNRYKNLQISDTYFEGSCHLN